ncbi:MAG: hypothetical protein ACI9VS_002092, partial [Candidatus Binatia bacterium]
NGDRRQNQSESHKLWKVWMPDAARKPIQSEFVVALDLRRR